MKILQLCHKMPFPLYDGGAYSLYHSALGLVNVGADIKVLAINSPKNWIDESEIPAVFRIKTRFECCMVNTQIRPLNAFINLFGDRSYFVVRFWSKRWNSKLIKVLKQEEFDIVQLEHIYMCLYIKTIRKYSHAKLILRPQNVENEVWSRFLKGRINPVKKIYLQIATHRLRKFERRVAQEVDGIIAISGKDAETFRAYAPKTPLITVPIGFDFGKINSYNWEKQFEDFPVFYHLGSMDWFPNFQGIKWFIEEVLPFVKNEFPEFVFRIAGKKMPPAFLKQQDNNLIVDQEVKESHIYHEDKAVMIVPLLSGSGLRAKIVEGMALGKTIISTTIGAEGIPYTDQKDILIANTKEDFAIQIKKCRDSKELCQKIGRNAQRLAKENYDCNKNALSMIQFYKSLN